MKARPMLTLAAVIAAAPNAWGQNLITNGEFELGNSGFTSEYAFGGVGVTENTYDVVADPHSVHSAALSYGDHPCGTGLMMVVNGGTTPDRVIWRQTVSVQRNRTYRFSAWASTWFFPSPARLSFRVNGVQIGAPLELPATEGQWVQFSANWASGNAVAATLTIVDLNLDPGGNDFALDNLFFGSASATPGAGLDLFVSRLELNQSLQTADDAIGLVAGKPTMVRAHVQFTDTSNPNRGEVRGVDGRLRVFVNDAELAGSPFASDNGPISVPDAPDPSNENDTLNFIITAPESGNVDFVVEINTPRRIGETDYCNNRFERSDVAFECRIPPQVFHVVIDYRPTAPGPGANYPDPAVVAAGDVLAQTAFPMPISYQAFADARWDLTFNQLLIPSLFLKLNLWRDFLLQHYNEPLFVFAWFPGNANIPFAGGQAIGSVGWGEAEDVEFAQHTFAHELAHMFGVCHVSGTGGTDLCGLSAFGFPWITPQGALGGLGVDVASVYGAERIKGPADSCGLCPDPNTPGSMCSIMLGGCTNNREHSWLDRITYETILDSPRVQCGALAGGPPTQGEALLIRGTYAPAGPTAALEPLIEIDSLPFTPDQPGAPLVVRAINLTTQEVLYERHFALAPPSDGVAGDVGVFALVTPQRGGVNSDLVDRVEIRLASTEQLLAARNRSPSPPEVQFTAPVVGEWLADGSLIEWTGSDPDGDALRYTLAYSWDDGATFIPLLIDSTEESFALRTAHIPGSYLDQAYFRLTTSDGVNTVVTLHGPFTVDARKPPHVAVVTPRAGSEAVEGAPVLLTASATDAEDGPLPDGAVTWTSDIDGIIALGRTASVAMLSVGVHLVTATAIDSDGQVGSTAVPILISPRAPSATPGDIDADGDVDSVDAQLFEDCLGGAVSDGLCQRGDLDADGDVDCADYALLADNWTGPPATAPLLAACVARGDANCDGVADFFDIDPFILALFEPTTYAVTYCGGLITGADINCDLIVDFFDIDAFLDCLFAACPPCP